MWPGLTFKNSTFCSQSALREKLVKCYIWDIALCGAGTWFTLESRPGITESFEMWRRRRMETISWMGGVKNEVLRV